MTPASFEDRLSKNSKGPLIVVSGLADAGDVIIIAATHAAPKAQIFFIIETFYERRLLNRDLLTHVNFRSSRLIDARLRCTEGKVTVQPHGLMHGAQLIRLMSLPQLSYPHQSGEYTSASVATVPHKILHLGGLYPKQQASLYPEAKPAHRHFSNCAVMAIWPLPAPTVRLSAFRGSRGMLAARVRKAWSARVRSALGSR